MQKKRALVLLAKFSYGNRIQFDKKWIFFSLVLKNKHGSVIQISLITLMV